MLSHWVCGSEGLQSMQMAVTAVYHRGKLHLRWPRQISSDMVTWTSSQPHICFISRSWQAKHITITTRRLTRCCFVELEYEWANELQSRISQWTKVHPLLQHVTFCVSVFTVAPSREWKYNWLLVLGLYWVRMSRNHVFHSGQKYTILSLSGRGMSSLIIRFQINDILLRPRAVHRQSGKMTEIESILGGFGAPKILSLSSSLPSICFLIFRTKYLIIFLSLVFLHLTHFILSTSDHPCL